MCGSGSETAPTATSSFDRSLRHEDVTIKEALGEGLELSVLFWNFSFKIKK